MERSPAPTPASPEGQQHLGVQRDGPSRQAATSYFAKRQSRSGVSPLRDEPMEHHLAPLVPPSHPCPGVSLHSLPFEERSF